MWDRAPGIVSDYLRSNLHLWELKGHEKTRANLAESFKKRTSRDTDERE